MSPVGLDNLPFRTGDMRSKESADPRGHARQRLPATSTGSGVAWFGNSASDVHVPWTSFVPHTTDHTYSTPIRWPLMAHIDIHQTMSTWGQTSTDEQK